MAVAPAVGWGAAGPKSGAPCCLLHAKGDTVRAASPDFGEASTLVIRCRILVQEYGDAKPLGNQCSGTCCQLHARLHRRAVERDERHHIHRAHAGMDAVVRPEIDRVDGNAEQTKHGVLQRRRLADEGVDRPVVRWIG